MVDLLQTLAGNVDPVAWVLILCMWRLDRRVERIAQRVADREYYIDETATKGEEA